MPPDRAGADMDVVLKYLVEDRDRHGNVRRYVRVPGRKKVRLKHLPGTEEFLAEYAAAMAGVSPSRAPGKGSFRALTILYYGSAVFRRLDVSTQSWRRRALDSISIKHGSKPVRLMQARHVRRIRDELIDKPAAGNQRLKALKALFSWAIEEDEAQHNPTIGVQKISYASLGFATASADEIVEYKERHPLGSKARLALDLLRFTTGRREDIPLLGPGHVRNGRIRFRQQKNKDRKPIDIDMPVHPDLAASIEATPSKHMTFLVTDYGKPYSTNGFGNAMRDWLDQANLHHLSSHSFRKGTAVALAEGGASAHEIGAITGHQTLEEVERYTRAARRRKLADSAMKKLKG